MWRLPAAQNWNSWHIAGTAQWHGIWHGIGHGNGHVIGEQVQAARWLVVMWLALATSFFSRR